MSNIRPNYKSQYTIKRPNKQIKVLSVQGEMGVSPKLASLLGYPSPDFTFSDQQISNRVHIVITCKVLCKQT